MKRITFLVLLLCGFLSAQENNVDKQLQQKIEEYTRDFKGIAGVYVYNLETGKEAGINPDTIFPTASIVKIPILIGLFDKIEKEEITLNDTLLYRDSRAYGGSGVMQFYKDSTVTDLRTLAALMITYSDNVTMYRMLSNSFYTDYALSQIPPYIQTAAKQGMVNKSRSEAVLVNAPSGDYAFYIATKDNQDTSWDYGNEAWELQRNISAMLWNYFEPESDWEPAENSGELVRGLRY
ncbi:MAG: serine hydrolase [Salegentibacter sp.]|uniref:serine hydrolase n=1 Tax=Salegentibacter sp. TaxID=1903072 RepID=UPI00286FFAA3|nr:serine hydrolase [Salegentibacter sp.]MDR9456507.1 serine hydrolase [Salegentibacter sp.]